MNFIFPFSWECHHPNCRTPSFFKGVGIPPTDLVGFVLGIGKKQQMGIQDWFRRKVEDFTSGYWDMEMKSMVKLWKISHKALKNRWIGHSVGISWFNGAFFSVHYIPPSPMVWQYHKPTMTDLDAADDRWGWRLEHGWIMTVHSVWNVIIPNDELHHFSKG